MTIGKRTTFLLAATLVATLLCTTSFAVEVRHTEGARYQANLTRGYAACTAPNTTTSNGVPACAPPVTSVCSFTSGGLDMRKREDTNEINLDVNVNNVSGPGACATGPYTLFMDMRLSFDDATCTGGECTLIDVPVQVALLANSNDFRRLDYTLEDSFPDVPTPIANYEILRAEVRGPDNLPMAAVGAGDGPTNLRTDLGTTYEECTAPDTANYWGVPACSAPLWASQCDFGEIDFQFESLTPGPRMQFFAEGLIGAPAQCADGTYSLVPNVRVTTDDCGTLCTLVDVALPFAQTVERGRFVEDAVLLASHPSTTFSFLENDDNVELLSLTLLDPLGDALAGPAVTPTLRLDKARVQVARRDLALADDKLTLKGSFPHPPLDPTVGGAVFTARDKDGVVYTATIPAGAWEVEKPGSKWRYKDDLGTINGVYRAEIREFRRGGSPTGFKLRLLARDLNLNAADLPAINLIVAASDTGGDTEVATRGTICKLTTKQVNCK